MDLASSRTILLPVIAAMFGTGCNSRAPTIIAHDAKVTAVSNDGVDFALRIAARNPGDQELSSGDVIAKAILKDNVELESSTARGHQLIPPHGKAVLEVPMSMPWKDVNLFFDLGSEGRDVPFKLDGKLVVLGASTPTELPFHTTGVVSGDQLKRAMQQFATGLVTP